jgi:hypothetical protein
MESKANESEPDNGGLLIILNGINRFFGEITKENKKFNIKDRRNDKIFGIDIDLFAGYIAGMAQVFELEYNINNISKIFWIEKNKLNFLANINQFSNKNGTFIWINCSDKKINGDFAKDINEEINNTDDISSPYKKIGEVLDKSGKELFFKDKKIAIGNRFKNNIFQKTNENNSASGIVSLLNELFNKKNNKEEFIISDDSGNQYYFSVKMNEFWNLFKNCLEKIDENADIANEIIGMNLILELFKKKPDKFKDAFFETIEGGLKGMAEKHENKNVQYYSMLADIGKNFFAKYKTLLAPEILSIKKLSEQIGNYKYSQKDYNSYLKIINNLDYFGIGKIFPNLLDFESNFKKLIEISAAGESNIKNFSKKNIKLLNSFGDKKYSPYLNGRKEEIDKIKKILGFSEHLENVKETVDSIKKK